MLGFPPYISRHQQRTYLRQQGFTPEQITRVMILCACYRTGRYQQEPEEYRRLHFVRWLYQQGKIER